MSDEEKLKNEIRTNFLKELDIYAAKIKHYNHYGDEGCGMCLADIKKTLDKVLNDSKI